MSAKKHPSVRKGAFLSNRVSGLCALDVRCARAFFSLGNFEGDDIADFKVIECHTLELLGMEEKILFLAFASNESKSAIRERFDCSGHVNML